MSQGAGGDKTEKPTPERLRKARSEGQIPRTPDLPAWLCVGAAALLLPRLVGATDDRLRELLARVHDVARQPEPAVALDVFGDGLVAAATVLVPVAAVAAVAALAGSAAQGGVPLAWAAAKPRLDRLDPVKGFKQRFGLQALWEGAKSAIKTLALAGVTWLAVERLVPFVTTAGALPLSGSVDALRGAAASLVQTCVAVGLVIAAADYVVARRRVMKEVRMSRQEVKDEHKRSEGDPLLKQARRSRALALSRNRMMADVASADVVVVNPVHVAVALRYDPARGAPRVVAKGRGHIARRIRERAAEHGVPLVADVPLARTLHDACRLGEEIPAALYGAVAEVLAFLMSLRRSGRPAGRDPAQALVAPRR